jgi:crotonobetainyl-CoA:carnitine CoA-transferase CaiB-like acyl-CoA transferase
VLGWAEGPTELRFATNPERVVHRRELLASLSARAAHREVVELADALLQAGVPAGRVRSLDEVFSPGTPGAALVRTDAFGRRVSPVAYSMES